MKRKEREGGKRNKNEPRKSDGKEQKEEVKENGKKEGKKVKGVSSNDDVVCIA